MRSQQQVGARARIGQALDERVDARGEVTTESSYSLKSTDSDLGQSGTLRERRDADGTLREHGKRTEQRYLAPDDGGTVHEVVEQRLVDHDKQGRPVFEVVST